VAMARSGLAVLALLTTAGGATAQPPYVVDGDTFDLAGERIRLWGIDAPEDDQLCQRNGRPWRCGDDATAALEALVEGHEPACTERDRVVRRRRRQEPDQSTERRRKPT
jgi:endonuclease YncB( thermonuclease family)